MAILTPVSTVIINTKHTHTHNSEVNSYCDCEFMSVSDLPLNGTSSLRVFKAQYI